jgi:hypothetical protein
MRRFFGLATVLVALSLAFPIGASAGPAWGRVPPGTLWIDAPPGLICPEAVGEVTWTYLGGNVSWVDMPGGRQFIGMGIGRWEVAGSNGKSIVVVTDSLGSVSPPRDDGSTVQRTSGRVMWAFFPGDLGPGDRTAPRTFLFAGSQNAVVAVDGTGLEFTWSGQILMDVCAAIS